MGAQDDRWKARARELFPKLEKDEYVIGSMDVWRDRALQLGREMADARAEEIAKRIDLVNVYSTVGRTTEELCAAIARGFISKPAEADEALYLKIKNNGGKWRAEATQEEEARIRADEREKCAAAVEEHAYRQERGLFRIGALSAARAIRGADKSETREQVLEEALLKVPCTCAARNHNLPVWDAFHTPDCAYFIARRALEWKP